MNKKDQFSALFQLRSAENAKTVELKLLKQSADMA